MYGSSHKTETGFYLNSLFNTIYKRPMNDTLKYKRVTYF